MNKLEFLKLIANAPKRLKGYSELLDYARNAYKQIMGVFPEGIDNISIKQAAKEAAENRSKVVEFPKDKITDPFKPRPGEGELSVTIEGQTKNMTPEGIMDLLMGKGKAKDVNIGKAPKTTKTKPAVDPELQKAEDQKQLFMDFEGRNKIRPGKINYDKMGEFLGVKLRGDETFVNVGIFGGGGFSKNQIVPGVNVATTDQNYGIMGQIPIGNTGLTLSADYMKSRANERFTGPRIPNQVFKNVPVDSDKFNVGINFTKTFKDGGRIGFKDGTPKDPSKRSFIKLMGGLAALPFVGKLFKPAAKVAETAGPVIAEGVKLGFDKFMMLVDKIKRLGRKTDAVTQKEREQGFVYQGKDGSEYELVEDLTTGDLRITKDKPGGMTVGDESFDTIEDRSTFVLRRNQADETTKGKKPPDEYDEMKEVAGRDGTFDDIDEVDDGTVKEILEELGETRTKKASGGLAYMLGE
jgi:hypothetical protein